MKLTRISYHGAGNSQITIDVGTCVITVVDKTTGVKTRTASIILDQTRGLEFARLMTAAYQGQPQAALEDIAQSAGSLSHTPEDAS